MPLSSPRDEPSESPRARTEDERKHLDFIQAAISRMASASSTAKGWLLPVVTATYGYALTQHAAGVALLGIAVTALFCWLDVQYLRQERAFRSLYRAALRSEAAPFEMATARFLKRPPRGENDEREAECSWSAVISSWSTGGFYGLVALVGLVIAAAAAATPAAAKAMTAGLLAIISACR